MPTRVALNTTTEAQVISADEFLDSLEPGMHADLVVEVLSERTAYRDGGDKFVEYEQQGVREYWVLDPYTLAYGFFARAKRIFKEFARGEGEVASRVLPGLVLKRGRLDPAALPKVADCLDWVRARG